MAKTQVKITKTQEIEVSITKADILRYLHRDTAPNSLQQRGSVERKLNPPDDAEVFVRVPGLSEWHGLDLPIDDKETTITVRWKEVTKS